MRQAFFPFSLVSVLAVSPLVAQWSAAPVMVALNGGGTWTLQITNPDRQVSNIWRFSVQAPLQGPHPMPVLPPIAPVQPASRTAWKPVCPVTVSPAAVEDLGRKLLGLNYAGVTLAYEAYYENGPTGPGKNDRGGYHPGIDFRARTPLQVYAPTRGTVDAMDTEGTHYGRVAIKVEGTNDDLILLHLSKVSVRPGQRVNLGDVIGRTGRTSPDPIQAHLHVEVRSGNNLAAYYFKTCSDVGVNRDPTSASSPRNGETVSSPATNQQPAPSKPNFHEMTVPAGVVLELTLGTRVGSDISRVEDRVSAMVAKAVVISGMTVIPLGARADASVIQVQSGTVTGRALVAIQFNRLTVANALYSIHSARIVREADVASPANEIGLGAGAAVRTTLDEPVTVRVPD